MFPYNKSISWFCFLLIFSLSSITYAEGEDAAAANSASMLSKKEIAFTTLSLSYVSWAEKMTLDYQGLTDESTSMFSGTGFHVEKQIFWGRTGVNIDLGLLVGSATGGGNSTLINYTAPKVSFVGLESALKVEQRINPQLSFSLGPILFYRKVTWDTSTLPGVAVASGSEVNAGLVGEFRIRLNPNWDLRQEIGTLAFRASTFWLLGVGYKL